MSKKITIKRRTARTRKFKTVKKGQGLPSFQIKSDGISQCPTKLEDDNNSENYLGSEFDELPCDALLAIQSIQSANQGIHIPLENNRYIQGVLPSQIFQRFEEGHASTIWNEILSLVDSSQLLRLPCQDEGEKILLLANDYRDGVWDSLQKYSSDLSPAVQKEVVSWFLKSLPELTEASITYKSLETCWKEDIIVSTNEKGEESPLSFHDALQFLLRLTVLLRVSTSGTSSRNLQYNLWLPQWGLVLKSWNEARQQLLNFITRSKGGEASEKNLLNRNRHPALSTKFILDELIYKGKVEIIERPFGRFVKKTSH